MKHDAPELFRLRVTIQRGADSRPGCASLLLGLLPTFANESSFQVLHCWLMAQDYKG